MRVFLAILAVLILVAGAGAAWVWYKQPELGYLPNEADVLNPTQPLAEDYYELFGRRLTPEEASQAPAGMVHVTQQLIEDGRRAFYLETYGNEIYLTDIVGVLDGPVTFWDFSKALISLHGEGTSNLRVRLSKDALIGGRQFRKGDVINTGIDVPAGSMLPMGLVVKMSREGPKMGITCALCHSTVEPNSHRVIHGAPNADFEAGLLFALGSNSTAYFPHVGEGWKELVAKSERRARPSSGSDRTLPVPNPQEMEDYVDSVLLSWPAGNFDSTIDMVANPSQIPDSFTAGDHPYGWSGALMAGPFKGLSAFNSNVHAQNSDATAHPHVAQVLFGLDPDQYMAIGLQNAPERGYRYSLISSKSATEFFASVDPTPGSPGINETVVPASFPQITPVAPDGLVVSNPGQPFFYENNAMSAWQNQLLPPPVDLGAPGDTLALGRQVFERANCTRCHAGPYLTNNRIVPVADVGTEPSRAKAFKRTQPQFGAPKLYPFDAQVPLEQGVGVLPMPMEGVDPEQLKLGWAQDDSDGGYKTPSLIGLYWTAPYLHDGGVAASGAQLLGLHATASAHRGVDPAMSLRALLDRSIREAVVAANLKAGLDAVHDTGQGHMFWVDQEAGYTQEQQDALIAWLLTRNEPVTASD